MTDDKYIIERDKDGTPVEMIPVKAVPVVEDNQVVGYVADQWEASAKREIRWLLENRTKIDLRNIDNLLRRFEEEVRRDG